MGSIDLFTIINNAKEIVVYIIQVIEICSMVKFISIKKPKIAVPKAVENTIKAVVRALILPIYLTP